MFWDTNISLSGWMAANLTELMRQKKRWQVTVWNICYLFEEGRGSTGHWSPTNRLPSEQRRPHPPQEATGSSYSTFTSCIAMKLNMTWKFQVRPNPPKTGTRLKRWRTSSSNSYMMWIFISRWWRCWCQSHQSIHIWVCCYHNTKI